MIVRNLSTTISLLLAAALFGAQAIAQSEAEELLEKAKEEARELLADEDEEAAAEAPEMSPEMAEMMEAWVEANTPGPQHERLAWFEGEWTTEASHWMEPGEPQTMSGTSSMNMVLDGRFLHDRHDSEWMGQAFTGLGYTGYDNIAGEYFGLWLDSMSTGMFMGKGRYDEESNRYEYHGEMADPSDPGKPIPIRYELQIDNDNQFTFNWFEDRGEGEMKTMEIVYTRAE